jgi:hypothetical protein
VTFRARVSGLQAETRGRLESVTGIVLRVAQDEEKLHTRLGEEGSPLCDEVSADALSLRRWIREQGLDESGLFIAAERGSLYQQDVLKIGGESLIDIHDTVPSGAYGLPAPEALSPPGPSPAALRREAQQRSASTARRARDENHGDRLGHRRSLSVTGIPDTGYAKRALRSFSRSGSA